MGLMSWSRSLGMSLGLVLLGVGGAIAQPPTLEMSAAAIAAVDQQDTTVSEPDSAPPASAAFETYTLPAQFSIEMPQGWYAQGVVDDGWAMITSYQPESASPQAGDVKTEVFLVDEPPETYVDREIDSLIQAGYEIDRFGMASVNGSDAFRIWIIEMPGDFANQVITFVGFDDGRTAKIVSDYNDDSVATTDTILQIHRSFELTSEVE
jgi:hypothetical protein